MAKQGDFVYYDEGTAGSQDQNAVAIVKEVLENGNANLEVLPDSGAPYPQNNVPLRAEGGGDTYHTEKI